MSDTIQNKAGITDNRLVLFSQAQHENKEMRCRWVAKQLVDAQ